MLEMDFLCAVIQMLIKCAPDIGGNVMRYMRGNLPNKMLLHGCDIIFESIS